ncbi:unnamed protein product [Adineta steineri]|uniref:Uncharacterized protein n=1 Tax=Adineta steineri TaxID=433720 RepID=A0A813Y114_9BILA|nr:unnamed protein product [Adineta steineri]CAF3727103.1 unnamed protein product [Adineta steineri]
MDISIGLSQCDYYNNKRCCQKSRIHPSTEPCSASEIPLKTFTSGPLPPITPKKGKLTKIGSTTARHDVMVEEALHKAESLSQPPPWSTSNPIIFQSSYTPPF